MRCLAPSFSGRFHGRVPVLRQSRLAQATAFAQATLRGSRYAPGHRHGGAAARSCLALHQNLSTIRGQSITGHGARTRCCRVVVTMKPHWPRSDLHANPAVQASLPLAANPLVAIQGTVDRTQPSRTGAARCMTPTDAAERRPLPHRVIRQRNGSPLEYLIGLAGASRMLSPAPLARILLLPHLGSCARLPPTWKMHLSRAHFTSVLPAGKLRPCGPAARAAATPAPGLGRYQQALFANGTDRHTRRRRTRGRRQRSVLAACEEVSPARGSGARNWADVVVTDWPPRRTRALCRCAHSHMPTPASAWAPDHYCHVPGSRPRLVEIAEYSAVKRSTP